MVNSLIDTEHQPAASSSTEEVKKDNNDVLSVNVLLALMPDASKSKPKPSPSSSSSRKPMPPKKENGTASSKGLSKKVHVRRNMKLKQALRQGKVPPSSELFTPPSTPPPVRDPKLLQELEKRERDKRSSSPPRKPNTRSRFRSHSPLGKGVRQDATEEEKGLLTHFDDLSRFEEFQMTILGPSRGGARQCAQDLLARLNEELKVVRGANIEQENPIEYIHLLQHFLFLCKS